MKRAWLTLVILGLSCEATLAFGYDIPTHAELGLTAAGVSSVGDRLVQDLDVAEGQDRRLQSGALTFSAARWIGYGAGEEDEPSFRVLNHFHNPLVSWDAAGLRVGVQLGQSSLLWAQAAFQRAESGGGTWSWPVARARFLAALTGRTSPERDAALADTFRALGHVTHLVQDATVPAHARNDPHLSIPLPGGRRLAIDPDPYEDWVDEAFMTGSDAWVRLLALDPIRPLPRVFQSAHAEAPIPVAGILDTDQFTADGAAPRVLGPASTGMAEFTNGNFVSSDTFFADFRLPAVADLGDGVLDPVARRRYFPKLEPGTSAVEIPHFVAESALARSLRRRGAAAPPRTLFTLDARVHEDYARELVPRAIGYSAGLLDYFFRGRLDVDVAFDPVDPTLVRLTGTNASPETLSDGTLALYADTPAGTRVRAVALDPVVVTEITPDDALVPARFQAPDDAERFVAIYQGTLGGERRSGDFPGAIIGKTLGGVRVEELFADGDRWRLRTPTGVFDLPLATAVYENVTWGDADDIIVARTPFADDPAGFVETYAIVRRPGSVEPSTSGTPPTVELRSQAVASLAFAAAPLVTTLVFDDTIEHRQQIGRWTQNVTFQWSPEVNLYRTVSMSHTPPQFETVHAQTVRFAATLPIRLDVAHNLELGDEDLPYLWQLLDVAADRGGRILGLVAIFLTQPSLAPVDVPWFRLDAAGQPVAAQTLRFNARFPDDATTIWALVDLDAGVVVASTAEPTVTISSRRASEAPPWGNGGFGTLQFPGLYRHTLNRYSGGSRDGQVDDFWDPTGLATRRDPGGVDAAVDASIDDVALSVAGWFRSELEGALQRSGLGTFKVGETRVSTQTWSYVCLTTPCSADSDYAGLAVVTHRGGVLDAPAQLVDARRARPAPAGERLVLLGDAFRDGPRPIGSVVAWDVDAGRAREAFAVPASFHDLGPQAATGAVLLSYSPPSDLGGTFFVGLEEGSVESFFAEADLTSDFTPLAPARLYSVRDFRFYRGGPPLQPTPLPARLIALPNNPVGDYHAIRVP